MAIPLGLARQEKGVAAFSGFVGYIVMHLSINFYLTETGQLAPEETIGRSVRGWSWGIQTFEMGVLGGIIAGIIVYVPASQVPRGSTPRRLRLLRGARFVPIITALVMSVVGIAMPIIWPLFAWMINGIGSLIQKAGAVGPFLFGAGERLLLPFGLHHILVALIRFTEAGGTAVVCGETVAGALNIFYKELACPKVTHFSVQATQFLSQGKMPSFLFGLPAVALAIYHTAYPENRKRSADC